MRKKTIAAMALAVNLAAIPAVAEEPTLEGCREGIMQWTLESDLIESIVNTDEGIAITPNQELLDQLPDEAREYIERCLEMVTTASDPEEWEEGPWEPGPEDEAEI